LKTSETHVCNIEYKQMETVKWDGDGLVFRRPGALAVADGCRGVSVTGSAEDGPRRRDM
jgi:hypothetical protein